MVGGEMQQPPEQTSPFVQLVSVVQERRQEWVTRMTACMRALVGEGVRQSPICRLPLQVHFDRHALAAIRLLADR